MSNIVSTHAEPFLPNAGPVQLIRKDADDQKVIEMWLHQYHAKPNTLDAYRRGIRYFREFVGFVPLRSLTLEEFQQYETWAYDRGWSKDTIRQRINVVKSLFSFLTELGYTKFNIPAIIKPPKSDQNAMSESVLTEREVFRIIELEPELPTRLFIRLLYFTAARVSDLCALNWADFYELSAEEVQVTIQGQKGGKKSYPIIRSEVWQEVLQLRHGDSKPIDPVFRNEWGNRMTRDNAWRRVKKAVVRAGVNPDTSCHWFRASHATHADQRGAPSHLIRDTLGHASIATTSRYLRSSRKDSSSRYLGL